MPVPSGRRTFGGVTRYRRSILAAILATAAAVPGVRAAEPPADSPADSRLEAARQERLRWFREARFGLFIHWGLYAVPAGEWKGADYSFVGEWIMKWARIPVKEYEALAPRFDPQRFDADFVAALARDAGMKYVVITAKHHDGFSMFDSKATAFDIVDATPYKKDPLAALGRACAREGLKYGFYYSQAQDWHEPNAAGNDWDFPTPRDQRQPDEYLARKAFPQVDELLSSYGPLGLIWFDTPQLLRKEHVIELERRVRTKQPGCLVNSRIGHGLGDYRQMGDNMIPSDVYASDWEVPATLNDTWGHKTRDRHWKSAGNLVYRLVDVVSKGGNYLLNIGPGADGSIPPESVDRLREVGRWMARHGEAIYGSTHSPFSVQGRAASWRATVKPGFLYIHLLRWPAGGRFVLEGLRSPVTRAFLLSDPRREPLEVKREGASVVLRLPGDAPDPHVSVLALALDGEPDVDPALRWDADRDPILLTARDGSPHGPWVRYSEQDDSVSGFVETRDTLGWHLLVKKPGRFEVEVEYAAPAGMAEAEADYRAFGATLKATLRATGDAFRWARLGTLEVADVGLQQTPLRFSAPSPDVRVRAVRLTRVAMPAPVALSPEEKKAGFRLIFDGVSPAGWRIFGREDPPGDRWTVRDGVLACAAGEGKQSEGTQDLVTRERFGDFDLRWEWRIAPGGNSGVKYFVDEARGKPLGHEYQMLDDDGHPDAKNGADRRTGALYDVIAPAAGAPARPAGEWNESRLLVDAGRVEHWLNGARVVAYALDSAELAAAVSTSKFKDAAWFGHAVESPILLQDHGDAVSYRNMRILSLRRP